jgi:hypothetical protein
MVLHMLYGRQQMEDCVALLTANDTLLVMDARVWEQVGESLGGLPCPVALLDNASAQSAPEDAVARINTCDWLELVCRHPHSMSWA